MSTTGTHQAAFTEPIERSREVLERCAHLYDPDHITIAVSGGTDSTLAADLTCRLGPEYGLTPDSITHINTGVAVPQSRLVAKTLAEIHDLEFIEQGYRNPQDSIAHRILEHGWPGGYGGSPATGGHGLEWANRKAKPMDEVYVTIDGFQVWVSGARKLESKDRSGNVPDSGVEQDKPRRAWCAIIGGWTSKEKQDYIRERGLPVSEAYFFLGYSGECAACSFDDRGLLDGVDFLSPELGMAIRTLAVWVYMRARRGDIDIDPKQLCWGWEPDHDTYAKDDSDIAQTMVGCDMETCADRTGSTWILDLPDEQVVTRTDVLEYWETGEVPDRFPLNGYN